MKLCISIFLLVASLLLSTLVGCAPVDDTLSPTPDTTTPDGNTPIDSSVPEQNIPPTPQEPDEPNAPQPVPLEHYQLPYATEGAWFDFLSFEHMLSFMEAIPYLAQDSAAYQTLQAMNFPRRMTYYLPNPDTIPEGYEFVYGCISDIDIVLKYSSTPELYLDNYKHPDGSSWKWHPQSFPQY